MQHMYTNVPPLPLLMQHPSPQHRPLLRDVGAQVLLLPRYLIFTLFNAGTSILVPKILSLALAQLLIPHLAPYIGLVLEHKNTMHEGSS